MDNKKNQIEVFLGIQRSEIVPSLLSFPTDGSFFLYPPPTHTHTNEKKKKLPLQDLYNHKFGGGGESFDQKVSKFFSKNKLQKNKMGSSTI
jgi:hypothetical protein